MSIATATLRHSGILLHWLLHQAAAILAPRTAAPAPIHRLTKGATLRVQHPHGLEVVCLHGALWITHDGDVKDVVLQPGQRHTADRHACMLVHALDAAEVQLHQRRAL